MYKIVTRLFLPLGWLVRSMYLFLICLSLFCIVCLMLPVSLDCPFLIVLNVYFVGLIESEIIYVKRQIYKTSTSMNMPITHCQFLKKHKEDNWDLISYIYRGQVTINELYITSINSQTNILLESKK